MKPTAWLRLRPDTDRHVCLLWMEAAAEGTAAEQHLVGTLRRLRRENVGIERVIATRRRTTSTLASLVRLGMMTMHGVLAARSHRVLVARWHPLGAPVYLWWRLRGGRVVLLVQGPLGDLMESHGWTRKVPRLPDFARAGLRAADAYVTVAPGLVRWINEYTGNVSKEVRLISNGISVPVADSLTSSSLPPELQSSKYVCLVGNLAGWQGVDTAIAAVRSGEWPPDLQMVFVGDGAAAPQIEAAAGGRIHFLGRVPRATALAVTQGAVAALCLKKSGPHTEHGVSPYKIMEGAVLGTPVIATRVAGQTELVRRLGNGILVESGDVADLVRAVKRLHLDDEFRGRCSRNGLAGASTLQWEYRSADLAEVIGTATALSSR